MTLRSIHLGDQTTPADNSQFKFIWLCRLSKRASVGIDDPYMIMALRWDKSTGIARGWQTVGCYATLDDAKRAYRDMANA